MTECTCWKVVQRQLVEAEVPAASGLPSHVRGSGVRPTTEPDSVFS